MKFFHVYNEDCFKGLEKNGLLNADSGFKLQHCFAVPKDRLFNTYAAVGTPLYRLITENHIPFYVDRIAGGITYYPYVFDKRLIAEYRQALGDDFLGFQLHESASNRRWAEWPRMMKATGKRGYFDPKELREKLPAKNKFTPDGEQLISLSQDTPEYYASRTYAETVPDFVDGLHWLVSTDDKGRRFLSVFNNEGNMRTSAKGDEINRDFDKKVKITLNTDGKLEVFKSAREDIRLEKVDDRTYYATVAASDFVIFTF